MAKKSKKPNEPKKHTKTIRLSVQRFETDDWTKLPKDLWGARGDLRRAANEIMSRLYAERRRLSKGEKKQPDQTYCYQLLTGKAGECVYEPKSRKVSGGIKSALATKAHLHGYGDFETRNRGNKRSSTTNRRKERSQRAGCLAYPGMETNEQIAQNFPLWKSTAPAGRNFTHELYSPASLEEIRGLYRRIETLKSERHGTPHDDY